MIDSWHLIVKEKYKGFQIVKKRHALGGGYTDYFSIFKDDGQYSIITLNSIKACRNVIDTHVRNKSPSS